ncbi:CARDB domain-containing protein [Streptomyces sp. WAC06614]|uniref:CARDB domain-containing protein n=1 Tax=Streptomyces sp. WAC06614 TaxID=2487416 RepID=UPI000F79B73C|nr:DUF11 domain-containing protein [Streptomyces sp. WAC06614]RSS79571.1 DUF11 domain-containing protein [Streptomyces sp. WAC06614]
MPETTTGWKTTDKSKDIELWCGTEGVKPQEGKNLAELSDGPNALSTIIEADTLSQDLKVEPGTKLHVKLWHAPRGLIDDWYQYKKDVRPQVFVTPKKGSAVSIPLTDTKETALLSSEKGASWHRYAGTYTVPRDVKSLRFELRPDRIGNLYDGVSVRVEPPAPTLATDAENFDAGAEAPYTSVVQVPEGTGFTDGVFSARLPAGTALVQGSVKVNGGAPSAAPVVKDGVFSVPVGSATKDVKVAYEVAVPKGHEGPLELRPSLDYQVSGIGALRVEGPAHVSKPAVSDVTVGGGADGKDGYRVKVFNKGPDTARTITLRATDAQGRTVEIPGTPPARLASGAGWETRIPSVSPKLSLAVQTTTVDRDPSNNTVELKRPAGDPGKPAEADLAVTLTADAAQPKPGSTLTYTVTLTNEGSATAEAVRLTAVLPEGFKAKAPQGAVDGKTGLSWNESNLAAGSTRTITLKGQVPDGLDKIRASVAATTQTLESDTGDNQAELSLDVNTGAGGDGTGSGGGGLADTGAGGLALMGLGGVGAVGAGAWALTVARRRTGSGTGV